MNFYDDPYQFEGESGAGYPPRNSANGPVRNST